MLADEVIAACGIGGVVPGDRGLPTVLTEAALPVGAAVLEVSQGDAHVDLPAVWEPDRDLCIWQFYRQLWMDVCGWETLSLFHTL